jgi:hypothetical protein
MEWERCGISTDINVLLDKEIFSSCTVQVDMDIVSDKNVIFKSKIPLNYSLIYHICFIFITELK